MRNVDKYFNNKSLPQFLGAHTYNGAFIILDKVVEKLNNGFYMEFSIKPTLLSRTYRVLLVYLSGHQPYVYVLSPDIKVIADYREIPHLYNQENQRLCLTHPSYSEWTSDYLIMDFYIPWIAHWLYFYEDWLFSNEWRGGGQHPSDSVRIREGKKKKVLNAVATANKVYFKQKKLMQKRKDLEKEGCLEQLV